MVNQLSPCSLAQQAYVRPLITHQQNIQNPKFEIDAHATYLSFKERNIADKEAWREAWRSILRERAAVNYRQGVIPSELAIQTKNGELLGTSVAEVPKSDNPLMIMMKISGVKNPTPEVTGGEYFHLHPHPVGLSIEDVANNLTKGRVFTEATFLPQGRASMEEPKEGWVHALINFKNNNPDYAERIEQKIKEKNEILQNFSMSYEQLNSGSILPLEAQAAFEVLITECDQKCQNEVQKSSEEYRTGLKTKEEAIADSYIAYDRLISELLHKLGANYEVVGLDKQIIEKHFLSLDKVELGCIFKDFLLKPVSEQMKIVGEIFLEEDKA